MNELLPLIITLGQKYEPAMEITDQAEADAYFERLEHHLRWSLLEGRAINRAQAERSERSNLAYYAGYFSAATRARVERLFRCAHPIFGPIADHGQPTPDQAAQLGAAKKD